MGISKDNIPDRIKRSKARANFVSDLGDNFPIGVCVYLRQGTLGNWYDVWSMDRIQDDNHSDFISMFVNAKKAAPEYLSHCQNNYAIDSRSQRLRKAIISTVMKDGCVPQFTKPAKETQFLEDAKNLILSLDNDYENKVITDMRDFNFCGNNYHSKYGLFWDYCIRVMDIENGSGAHHHRKADSDTDTTTNVSFAPGLILITNIVQANIDLLEKEDKVKDTYVFLPGEQWVYMKLSPD